MEELLTAIQWPAMAVTVAAAWLVASRHLGRRRVGFCLFLASNVLWVVWGLHSGAIALVVLQLCLAALNMRGVHKADTGTARVPDGTWPARRPAPVHRSRIRRVLHQADVAGALAALLAALRSAAPRDGSP